MAGSRRARARARATRRARQRQRWWPRHCRERSRTEVAGYPASWVCSCRGLHGRCDPPTGSRLTHKTAAHRGEDRQPRPFSSEGRNPGFAGTIEICASLEARGRVSIDAKIDHTAGVRLSCEGIADDQLSRSGGASPWALLLTFVVLRGLSESVISLAVGAGALLCKAVLCVARGAARSWLPVVSVSLGGYAVCLSPR